MKVNIRDDFIGVFEDLFPDQLCESYIRFFHNAQKAGLVVNRQSSENSSPFQKCDLGTSANGTYLSDLAIEKVPELAEVYTNSIAKSLR